MNLSVSLQLLDCLRMQGTCLGILQNGEQAKVCLASVLVTISDIEAEYATTKAKTIPTTNSNDDAAAVDDARVPFTLSTSRVTGGRTRRPNQAGK